MVTGMERPRTCSCPWELSFTVLNSLPANSIVSSKVLLTAFPWGCISVCSSQPQFSVISLNTGMDIAYLLVCEWLRTRTMFVFIAGAKYLECLLGWQAGKTGGSLWLAYWFHKCCVPPLPGALLAPHQLSERMWVRWPCNDRLYMLLKAGWKQGLAEVRHWGVFLWGCSVRVRPGDQLSGSPTAFFLLRSWML